MAARCQLRRDLSNPDELVAKLLIKQLVIQKTPLKIDQHLCRQLQVQTASPTPWTKPRLLGLVERFPNNFSQFEDGRGVFIKPVTTLGLCRLHCSKKETCMGASTCTGLHICKFYLLTDKCSFGNECNFGHDLTSRHNYQLLREHLLDELMVPELKYLFRLSDNRNASTVPKACKFYNHQNGCRYAEKGKCCPNLHICKFYVTGNCSFGQKCRRNHNIFDPGVKAVLEKHGVNTGRTPKEILAELREALQNDGDDSRSEDGQQQRGFVPSGNASRWASQPLLGAMAGLSVGPGVGSDSDSSSGQSEASLPGNGRQRRRRRNRGRKTPKATAQGQNAGDAKVPVLEKQFSVDISQTVCLYNLRGKCAFGKSCRNAHTDMLYQWQLCRQGKWLDFQQRDNRDLELTYSQAENGDACVDLGEGELLLIDFSKMTGKWSSGEVASVRRLSTVSSGEVERQPLSTKWIWYWQDQTGRWIEYGNKNATGYKATLMSSDLEQKYLANPEGQLAFATMGHQYILDFKLMVQRNLEYKTQRKVRRRPEFVSTEEAQQRKKQPMSPLTPTPGGAAAAIGGPYGYTPEVPSHWAIQRGEDLSDHCQKVEIKKNFPSTRDEYKKIEKLFYDSMPNTSAITTVERIQNGELWINYVNKRNKMMKKRKKDSVDERQLFHGTQSSYVDAICRQGFDFRLSGQTSGSRFGKGSYFARDAKYSDCYTDRANKQVFVVKVLVGDYVKGEKSYCRPPSKDTGNPCSELYDSCVDDQKNPKIFVVFDFYQVYPEYVISYEMKYN